MSTYNSNGTVNATYVPLADANGNITGLIGKATGTVVVTYSYSAFGQCTSSAWTGTHDSSDPNPFRFSTHYQDENGLIYMGMRYYKADWGRFINRDPSGVSGGANLFAYCGNDPVNSVDAVGLSGGAGNALNVAPPTNWTTTIPEYPQLKMGPIQSALFRDIASARAQEEMNASSSGAPAHADAAAYWSGVASRYSAYQQWADKVQGELHLISDLNHKEDSVTQDRFAAHPILWLMSPLPISTFALSAVDSKARDDAKFDIYMFQDKYREGYDSWLQLGSEVFGPGGAAWDLLLAAGTMADANTSAPLEIGVELPGSATITFRPQIPPAGSALNSETVLSLNPTLPAKGGVALGKDIAGQGMKGLAEQTESSWYRNWARDGITRRTVSNNFGRAFHDAVNRAPVIRFSLDGIDDIPGAVRAGRSGFTPGNMTNAELEYLSRNPDLLNKTIFYRTNTVTGAAEPVH